MTGSEWEQALDRPCPWFLTLEDHHEIEVARICTTLAVNRASAQLEAMFNDDSNRYHRS